MHALLGKITSITQQGETPPGTRGASLEIRFKAACVLPQRGAVPEWLKDQVLTIQRQVVDAREIGHPGDNIVLTPAESARWLCPLQVMPDATYGELPERLQLQLRWWKDDKPPEFTVRANGKGQTGQFTKDGDGYTATAETAAFFESRPRLPVQFEITCDKLKAACTVVSQEEPGFTRLALPDGERYRVENPWYQVEILARAQAGGIAALREQGRQVDHFRGLENRILPPLFEAGHTDRIKTGWGWSDKLNEVALTCAGTRHEGGATRLSLEGVVDEGQNLRTSVDYTLYDNLPIVLLDRSYRFHKGKGKEGEGKDKEEKPKEIIDDVRTVGIGFRSAALVEQNGHSGSRILCSDGQRLAVTRPARAGEYMSGWRWQMADGWVIAEHPGRRECLIYLFDAQSAPRLGMWRGPDTITLEPSWDVRPVRPEEAVGYCLGLTAGERCGAEAGGGWVACRTALPGGGVRCAAVGRVRGSIAQGGATFRLGRETREAPIQNLLIPGVGSVLYAAAEFPGGGMDDPFDVSMAQIAGRRTP